MTLPLPLGERDENYQMIIVVVLVLFACYYIITLFTFILIQAAKLFSCRRRQKRIPSAPRFLRLASDEYSSRNK
jgi:dolichol kinase